MKKLFFTVFLLISAQQLHARSFNYEEWRSTEVNTSNYTSFLVATAPITVDKIIISSTTGNCFFQVFDSSSSNSASYYRTYAPYSSSTPIEFNSKISVGGGFVFTKTGNCAVHVLWNWLFGIPNGQESRGR